MSVLTVGRRVWVLGGLVGVAQLACNAVARKAEGAGPGSGVKAPTRPGPDVGSEKPAETVEGDNVADDGAAKEDPDAATAELSPVYLQRTVYLQPLGVELPQADLEFILKAMAVFFPNEVKLLPALDLPKEAYYAPRSRYRAEKLLDFLESRTPEDAQVVMGLTAVDISTTKGAHQDWGILGMATIAGKQCVISRFRAKRGAKNEAHTRVRLAKTVAHEIGHTLGLLHCPTHGCIMEDGKGSVLTTDHEYDFCDRCRGLVGAKLKARNLALIPWEDPAQARAGQ